MMHDPIISAAPLATVERAALFPALDFIARRIVERRNTVPILSYVRLEALASGALLLSASDLDLEAAILVPADVEAPFIVAVAADTFRDLVKAAPKYARLTVAAIDGAIRLTYGRTRQNVPTLPADDMPALALPRHGNETLTLPAVEMAADLARVAPFAGKEETRYYLCGVELQADGAGVTFTATDGAALATLSRECEAAPVIDSAIIPSKAVTAMLQAMKGADGAASLTIGRTGKLGRRAVFQCGDIGLAFKLVDGTFPAWRAQAAAWSQGLEPVLLPELEPSLSPAVLDKARKAAGKVAVESGAETLRLTSADAPGWACYVSATGDNGRKGFAYRADGAACGAARIYLEGQRERWGLPDLLGRELIQARGRAVGMTVGVAEWREPSTETRLNWETLAEETVHVPGGRFYPDGAYSLFFPRADQPCVAEAAIELDGVSYPIRTNDAGAIELSAEQLRAVIGPVDRSEAREIPAMRFYQGRALEAGEWLPTPPKLRDADALRMTAEQMRDYADACRPFVPDIRVDPAPQPAPAAKPKAASVNRAERALAMLQGTVPGMGTRKLDDCFEMGDADTVAALMIDRIRGDRDLAWRVYYGRRNVRDGAEAYEVNARQYLSPALWAAVLDSIGDMPTSIAPAFMADKVAALRQNAPAPLPVESEPEPVQAPVEAVNGAPVAETGPVAVEPSAATETEDRADMSTETSEMETACANPSTDPVADALAILSARLDLIEARIAAAPVQGNEGAPPSAESTAGDVGRLPLDPRVRGVAIARAEIEAARPKRSPAHVRAIMAYLAMRKERAAVRAERDRLTIAHYWERKLRRRNAARLAAMRQRRELDRGALLAAGEFTRDLQARLAEAEKPKHPNDPDAALVAQLHEAWAERDRAREQAAATVKQAVARVEALERLLFKGDAAGDNVVPIRAAA